MDKLAQQRGRWNKLRERFSPGGRILEKLDKEFGAVMKELRDTDARIRENAAPLKQLFKDSKDAVGRRDYLQAAISLMNIHERSRQIVAELHSVSDHINLKHYDFLLGHLTPIEKEQLFGVEPKRDFKEASKNEIALSLRKNAGLGDAVNSLWKSIINERSLAMKALEKRFSIGFLKDLKNNSGQAVQDAKSFVNTLLLGFKELDSALAKRDMKAYKDISNHIVSKFVEYNANFLKYYDENIQPLKEQYKKLEEEANKIKEAEKAKEERELAILEQHKKDKYDRDYAGIVNKLPSSAYNSSPAPTPRPLDDLAKHRSLDILEDQRALKEQEEAKQMANIKQNMPSSPYNSPKSVLPTMNDRKNVLDKLDEENETNEPFELTKRKAAAFIAKIEKFAAENNPEKLALEILAFSDKLEGVNSDISLQLLAVGEGLIEDKTAGILDKIIDKVNPPNTGEKVNIKEPTHPMSIVTPEPKKENKVPLV